MDNQLVVPLRDVFAAIFFFWFGLTIAPSAMGAIALPVAIAVVVTLTFNVIAGVVAARPRRAGRRRGLNSKVAPFAGWLPRRLFPVPPPEPDEAVGAEADRVARLAASA